MFVCNFEDGTIIKKIEACYKWVDGEKVPQNGCTEHYYYVEKDGTEWGWYDTVYAVKSAVINNAL